MREEGSNGDMAFFSHSLTASSAISLTVHSTLFFFLVFISPPIPSSPSFPSIAPPLWGLLNSTRSCSLVKRSDGFINSFGLHYCIFRQNSLLSIPSLSLFLLFYFYVIIKTAQDTSPSSPPSSPPTSASPPALALSPSSPSATAPPTSSPSSPLSAPTNTALGSAIRSAGTFVSAFVVGFVAIHAAPFSLDPAFFVRDGLFYMMCCVLHDRFSPPISQTGGN
ncbi:hypothetical protein CRG98_034526 [Punica granatum]|uniref:Uncharacterized protein n=1 Tax=Punica granatum TaxID=22663 RepID=A0A2I0IM42_PUNGR|nr:hypothetical protein CRG98_034526 [Punica granatum]